MMVPHHQGAIEMAQAELRYGRNEPLRRMAQEIIVTQLQEIAAMLSRPPIACRLHLSDMREIVWYRVRRGSSLPRRECQRDD